VNVGKLLATEEREPVERWVRAHVQTVYCGSNVALCRVLGKYLCQVDTRDLSLAPYLMLDGFWEMWISQAIARHVQPGMICVDVGACFGYYTLLFAELAGPSGHVISYEPNPACAQLLRRTLALNGLTELVDVRESAVGSEQGMARLCLMPDRWGDSRLSESVPPRETGQPESLSFAVRKAPLDLDQRVDVMKIDAEGSEPDIWVGMQELLRRDNPLVLMEFAPSALKSPEALLALVTSSGYELAIVDEAGLRRPATREYLLGDGEIRTLWLQRQ
jgi:FkbM family methyltransferase